MKKSLKNRRILITGAARGIGAALAERLAKQGARLALIGLEPELLQEVGRRCGAEYIGECDVGQRASVERAVAAAVDALGGLDVVVANAGIAAQLPLIGGDPQVFDTVMRVNLQGTYDTLRVAGPHVAHRDGYMLLVASLGAAVHVPLMGAYSASKAGTEALGNALRGELAPTGARVGIAYFAELDTDMTRRGFDTRAARVFAGTPHGTLTGLAPLQPAIDALEQGIRQRSRTIASPWWVGPALPARAIVQRVVDQVVRKKIAKVVATARGERSTLTTLQPDGGQSIDTLESARAPDASAAPPTSDLDDSQAQESTPRPRIHPGTPRQLGPINELICRALGVATGTGRPNLFATLGRHRRLFGPWLVFAGALMPFGRLPRSETEMVILRVAHRMDCAYEWQHHVRIGQRYGLTRDDIDALREDTLSARRWSPRRYAILRAVDEIHDARALGSATWRGLQKVLTDDEIIELCMLVGHYQMLAQTISTLAIEPDEH
ncbi:SDR family NAD(P)-dependent oxidoreductase [Bradymonas sediminis]|uniref:SDR family NAD(P)-dependent oxidoreductase n=1 Tax=Bradymonas sediminis TaxID=1548548 RepID=UPI0010F23A6F|nr:SDR family NAD(P)-dependent oxidoreductase [Bradymonas sediminis]TDP77699.1 short-subunit dehydrogenase [Bradymonas sediminis]